jgi:hypothetical protein
MQKKNETSSLRTKFIFFQTAVLVKVMQRSRVSYNGDDNTFHTQSCENLKCSTLKVIFNLFK